VYPDGHANGATRGSAQAATLHVLDVERHAGESCFQSIALPSLPQLSCRGSAVAAAAAAANARLSLRWRCQMTNYLIRGALPSLIPLIAESQGWSQGQVAILFSAFPTGYVLTQIPAGEA